MIAGDEDLMRVRKFNEPVQKIKHFILGAVVTEVSAMNEDITFRKVLQKVVLAVRVGDLDYAHSSIFSTVDLKSS